MATVRLGLGTFSTNYKMHKSVQEMTSQYLGPSFSDCSGPRVSGPVYSTWSKELHKWAQLAVARRSNVGYDWSQHSLVPWGPECWGQWCSMRGDEQLKIPSYTMGIVVI